MCNRAPVARMKIARSFNCGKEPQNQSSPGGAADKIVARDSAAPPGLLIFCHQDPQLKLRAIFRLSLRDEASRRKPMVKKLERFVKFRPRTTLRDIIRLTA
jgi:hypothetical protein